MIAKKVLLGIVMLVLLTVIPTAAVAQGQDLVGKVKAWQAAFNAGDLDTAMATFAPNAEFEMVGLGTMTDRAMIEGIHAYAIGLGSQLRSPTCTVEGNAVTCETYETSEWHRIAGLPDTHYTSDIYVFNGDGLITKISATKAPESVQAEGEVLNSFIPWIAQNHPEAMPKLFTADNMFIYSGENAPIVLDLLREWKAQAPATLPVTGGTGSSGTLMVGLMIVGLLFMGFGMGLRKANRSRT
jgi:hypothetical protein